MSFKKDLNYVDQYVDKHFSDRQYSYSERVCEAATPNNPIDDHSDKLNIAQKLHDSH